MPITLRSIQGKVDYQVYETLVELVRAVNQMEQRLGQTRTDEGLKTRLIALERFVGQLQQQLNASEREIRQIEGGAGGGGGGGGGALGPVGAGSALPTVPVPNDSATVVAYANANPAQLANSCLAQGGNWDFMDGVVAALQAIDVRYGFNGKRGDVNDPSEDAISYYHGVLPPVSGSPNVYVLDIIANHCPVSGSAQPAWQDVTTPAAQGAWLATRP